MKRLSVSVVNNDIASQLPVTGGALNNFTALIASRGHLSGKMCS
jgi:hypothetical protein